MIVVGYHGNGLGLVYAWVGFIRFAIFHMLRYMIASYSSLCRSSHFVHTLTGILALAAMQRQPSNIIIFGLSFWLLQSSQPHPSNTIEFVRGVPGVFVGWVGCLCGLGWVSLLGYVMG